MSTSTTLTNRSTLTATTDQTIYQDKCRIRIVYLVLSLINGVFCSNICVNFDEYFRACCAVDWFQKRTRPTGRGCSILWFWPQLTFSSPHIHSQLIHPLYSRPFFFNLFANLSICLLVVKIRFTITYSDMWLVKCKVIVSMSGEKIFQFSGRVPAWTFF